MANLNQALGTDLAALAKLLKSKGRGRDTVLAHITPKEAALLKRRGGRGSINPDTGLPEFDDSVDSAPIEQAPIEQAPPPVDQAPPPVDQAPTYVPTAGPYTSDNQGLEPIPTQQDQAPTQSSFDPFSYSGGFGGSGQTYQGDPSQSTPSYAAPAAGATTFGTGGGASIDPNAPGAATLLEPTTPDAGTTTVSPDGTTGPKTPKSLTDQLMSGLNLGNLAGIGLGAYGASQARKTAGQINTAQQQQQNIAQPYQTQGQTLINQAQAGQLSPASQQAYAAAKAQLNQQAANRGGVGTQQVANQEAQIYQSLLDNQYNYGLKVMNIGDNIALGAIKQGLQLDAQLNTATTNFYSQLAQMMGSGFAPSTK